MKTIKEKLNDYGMINRFYSVKWRIEEFFYKKRCDIFHKEYHIQGYLCNKCGRGRAGNE